MLTEITENDLREILDWRNEPEVRKNMYTSHEISWEEHLNWYKKLLSDDSRICLKCIHDNSTLGIVNFIGLSKENMNAFWGFYAKVDAPRGAGVIIEYEALQYAFETLNLHKLNCEVIAFNKTVLNMHKKTGFVQEGILRDFHFDREKYVDVIRFGMLANEWPEAKSGLKKRLTKV